VVEFTDVKAPIPSSINAAMAQIVPKFNKTPCPFLNVQPILPKIVIDKKTTALCISFRYSLESDAHEIMSDINKNYSNKMKARYYMAQDVVGKIYPVPISLSDHHIAINLHACETIKFKRMMNAKREPVASIEFAIHPSEVNQLQAIKPFVTPSRNRPIPVVNIEIKGRPKQQYCFRCAGPHPAFKCQVNRTDLCCNDGCDDKHLVATCSKPLKCRICKMTGHHFRRCDIYTGGWIPLQSFISQRSLNPTSSKVSSVVSPRSPPSILSGNTSPTVTAEMNRLKNENIELKIQLKSLMERLNGIEVTQFKDTPTKRKKSKVNKSKDNSENTKPPASSSSSSSSSSSMSESPPLASSKQLFTGPKKGRAGTKTGMDDV
jgi:hypothetical protein